MSDTLVTIPLHRLAHARSGDKGDRLNISVIAYDARCWQYILDQVTVDRVKTQFAHRGASQVVRYELPKLKALNFVIDDVLEGGVNSSLNLDGHGKSNSFRLLAMEIKVPAQLAVTVNEDQTN